MTPAKIKEAAPLLVALEELPKVRRNLRDKSMDYDGFMLELSAAEMHCGEGQGSAHYFYLPPDLGDEVLTATEKIIRAKLKALGVKP